MIHEQRSNYYNILVSFNIAGRDFESDILKVHFQSNQSSANICIVIIDDDLKEGSEKFRLFLSIPYSTRSLGVWAKHPYYADVLITSMHIDVYECKCTSICMQPTVA